ncbi:multidrug resistance protein, SMR family [Heyndrickxia coagulans]|jgi:paired small multidrug resistance pump|uniref:Multidrug resistance protein, SMR family n=3 Tax=Heyndrickxia TaxID=2837504 RepID=A0A133KQP9_HEYCO|nr:multidrug resistance protein, SMR family [Heyndrickxia coagulans]
MKDHVFAMQPGGCFLCSSPGFFMEVFEMNKSWLIVLVGAFFEVFWVIGLKHADNLLEWAGTLVAITASFYALIAASKDLPVGTVYAVFVGLGTAGTVFSGIVFFGEPFSFIKIVLIFILLAGIIGLRIAENEKSSGEADS